MVLQLIRRDIPTADDDRARARYRHAAKSSIANFAARLVTFGVLLLSVRWCAPYLGTERFGLWMTFSGMAGILALFEFGVSNALVSQTAYMARDTNPDRVKSLVSGGLGWLFLLGCAVSGVSAIAAPLLPWDKWFGLASATVNAEAASAAQVFGVLMGLQIFFVGAQRVLIGLQRGYETNLVATGGAVASVGALWLAVDARADVPTLLLCTTGVQVAFLAPLVLWLLRQRVLVPGRIRASMSEWRGLLFSSGSLFLALQIGALVCTGSDTLVLASVLGSSDVATFAVAQRLFLVVSIPFAILNTPLWAAYADAHAMRDTRFLRQTLSRSLACSVLGSALLATTLAVFGQWLVTHWTKGSISVPIALLVALALWSVLEVFGNTLAMYLNGCNIVRPQVVVVGFLCVVGLPSKVFATERFGAAGMVTSTTLIYIACVVIPYLTVFRKSLAAPLK